MVGYILFLMIGLKLDMGPVFYILVGAGLIVRIFSAAEDLISKSGDK